MDTSQIILVYALNGIIPKKAAPCDRTSCMECGASTQGFGCFTRESTMCCEYYYIADL